MPLFSRFRKKTGSLDSSGDECEDSSAKDLSHVGTAAYDVLRKHHNHHHHELWNVTKGRVIRLDCTPRDAFTRNDRTDPLEGHDDWFPQKVEELIAQTEEWCDIMTLSPPDGIFLDAFKNGIKKICEKEVTMNQKRIIRIMFGNVVGQPVNCTHVIAEMTKDLPENAGERITLWIGSWRKGVSWNHAKIIAVDGKHLWTGGHNFWDRHYLKSNPTNDLAIYMDGNVARDGHRFANAQWGYIVKKQSTGWGHFVDRHISDAVDVPRAARVTISAFPESTAAEFPPFYSVKRYEATKLLRGRGPSGRSGFDNALVPVITMGRYGRILKNARPSDDAFVAMFNSAQMIIRCALQDIGPICVPKTKMTVPGMVWPLQYMNAMARAMWTRGVDVEIVLSNPGSIPDNLSMTEAQYGNGWSCVDVAAEIIKCIKAQFPDAPDDKLRMTVQDNLRVCFIRCQRGGCNYSDGVSLGLHSKHFIIDDVCCYIGSQNLYTCDLAEWGVVIDSPEAVADIKQKYWDQMWKVSYTNDDCDVDKVMDGLGIDRAAVSKLNMTKYELEQASNVMKANFQQYYNESEDNDESESDAEDENEEKSS